MDEPLKPGTVVRYGFRAGTIVRPACRADPVEDLAAQLLQSLLRREDEAVVRGCLAPEQRLTCPWTNRWARHCRCPERHSPTRSTT